MQIADQQDNKIFGTRVKPSRASLAPAGAAWSCRREACRRRGPTDHQRLIPVHPRPSTPLTGALRC